MTLRIESSVETLILPGHTTVHCKNLLLPLSACSQPRVDKTPVSTKVTAKSKTETMQYDLANTQSNYGIKGWACGLKIKMSLRLYLLFLHVPSWAFEF